MKLTVLVPSRGRPANARRLADAFRATADFDHTDLVFAVDDDDPELPGYTELSEADPWASLTVLTRPRKVGPILNSLAVQLAPFCNFIGFMGDDHLPRTAGWDRTLAGELASRPGVAYGNDLHQCERLPTAVVISAELVRALGYFCPPGLHHLYLDNFWKVLGNETHLAYRPDVIIEHLHPEAGKAPADPVYLDGGLSAELMASDGDRWIRFMAERWPQDRKRVIGNAQAAPPVL